MSRMQKSSPEEFARREAEVEELATKSRVSKFITHHSCASLAVIGVVILICIITTGALIEVNEEDERMYLVWDDIRVQRVDALNEAMEDVRKEELGDQEMPLRVEEQAEWTLYIMYHQSDNKKTLLNRSNLDTFEKVHAKIESNSMYSNVCLATSSTDTSCEGVQTFTNWFDTASTTSEMEEIMLEKATEDFTNNKIFFDTTFTETVGKARWGRSLFRFGLPLDVEGTRYKSSNDDFDAQMDYYEEFLEDVFDDVDDMETSDIDIYFYSFPWWNMTYNKLMMADFGFVIGSIMFVFFYMIVHTKSCVLPVLGIIQVLAAFPIAYTIYRGVMQIVMFNMMNMLAIFVILGIAADDIFVFMDAWNQSEQYACLKDDLEKRVAYVYRRAAKAMFVTTITTFSAFLATAISDLAPISAFGIFAANMILSNYLLVISFFPCCVVLRHKFIESRRKKKEAQKTGKTTEGAEAYSGVAMNTKSAEEKEDAADKAKVEEVDPEIKAKDGEPIVVHPSTVPLGTDSKVERFFNGPYMGFIIKAKYFVVAIFAIWFATAMWMATEISPPSKQENWFPEDHDISIAVEAIEDKYHKGEDDGFIKVQIVYGIDGLDRSDLIPYDVDSIGEVEWDKDFDLAIGDNQDRLVQLCTDLEDSSLVQDSIVKCFIADFKTWVIAQNGGDEDAFPVAYDDFHANLQDFLENDDIGYEHKAQKRVGYVGDDLKYVFIHTVAIGNWDPYAIMMPRWEKWEDLMDDFNKESKTGLDNGYQSSRLWTWMITEKALLRNAFQGMAIAGSISFVVLIMSTLNIILAFYAIFTISGIVTSVLGFVYMLGWEFGMVVSIAVVILIGFSVDYAVHVCHAYVESKEPNRQEKTRDALHKMGVSILGGAITTFGTGAVLFATSLVFFQKFAWIISSTIFFALIWSMVFLPSLLCAVGPVGDTGSLRAFYYRLKKKMEESRQKKGKQ